MKIETATFPALKGNVNKGNISKIASDICKSETPLKSYIGIKAIEAVITEVKENADFRERVKEDYLNISGGSISKSELFGVEVNTYSTLKKETLKKEYEYSDEINGLQNEIEKLEIDLKSKKDLLKAKKMQEINSGIAKEINIENITGTELTEIPLLKTFDLKITFKK